MNVYNAIMKLVSKLICDRIIRAYAFSSTFFNLLIENDETRHSRTRYNCKNLCAIALHAKSARNGGRDLIPQELFRAFSL